MQKSRWPIAVLLVLLLCVLAALCLACGAAAWFWLSRQTGDGVQPPLTSGTGAALRLAGGEPDTLDPALVTDSTSAEYVVHIFSGLVTLDSSLSVVPDLAERWEISPDGKTYTFYLRSGTRFQDGKELAAADVVYSLERACDPRTGSPVAAVYLGDIVGANEKLSGQATTISGLKAVDQRTIRITILEPAATFLAKLTYSTAFVLDRTNVESGNWLSRPNGSGPFRLKEFSSEEIVLQRNEHYYRDPPRLEEVVYHLSGGSPMSMYENGELDMVYVGPADVERVRDPANVLNAELTTVPQLDIQYLGLNVNRPPFDDVKVRRAFSLAIDRAKLTTVVWKDMRAPAEGIVPPGLPGFQRAQPLLAFDPQRARQLLAESRYGGPSGLPPVTLSIGTLDTELPPVIQALVAMYRDNLGVDIAVEGSSDVLAGDPQFYSIGWIADYPDPENFLDLLFHSGSGLNHMNYSNPQVDRLLESARVETNRQQRQNLFLEAERLIVSDAPWVPLWHSVDYVLTKPYVKGVMHSAAIFPWLTNVSIER
ncbi:MAG TPA: peptide ABC transporter substrate-binding protein [Anaerolineae bacterium]|nr:peptide ABC transporter substrate-binding protein [Anaerolineae bacterium]HNT05187.1 peptide ABC transporter substrate-binding protein [Anaerolineae bacterium]